MRRVPKTRTNVSENSLKMNPKLQKCLLAQDNISFHFIFACLVTAEHV